MDEITEQQERFCEEFIRDLNATQAAIRAGYSPNSANEQGSRLLANVKVRSRIDQLKKERSERTKITADDLIEYLMQTLTFDPSEVLEENGDLKPLSKIRPEIRNKIMSVKTTKFGREIGFFSREKALEMLARHHALFNDKVKIEHTYTDLSDEDLAALAEQRRKEAEG